jgi:transposase-like protein
MAGRKPKLNKMVIKRLEEALLAGNYIETACDYAGINRATFYKWMAEAEKSGAKPLFRELSDTVTSARAQAEMRNVLRIQKAADDSWQAAGWWLERSFPQRWGRHQKVELSGSNGGAINVSLDAKQALVELIKAKQQQE